MRMFSVKQLAAMTLLAISPMAMPTQAALNDAKTIVVRDLSGGNFFALLELEAISAGVNVAAASNGGTIFGSSTGFGGPVAGAIDGNTSAGCCGQLWHANGPNSYAVITLPAPTTIDNFNVFGRQGCCPERTDNFEITVLNSSNVPIYNQQVLGAGTASQFGTPVSVAANSSSAAPAPVSLQNATATFHQGNFGNVGQTIDGNSTAGGMGFFNNRTSNTIVAYETAVDISGAGELTFSIAQNLGAGHTIQRFRLSVTDADRSLFANGLPASGAESPAGDVTTGPGNWTLIDPTSVLSINGATATIDANGIVTVSGLNPAHDTFVIKGSNPLGNVTGVRLEVLPGGNGVVGRSLGAPHNSNGNAVITEFSTSFAAGVGPRVIQRNIELSLQNATATFDQGGAFGIGGTIDGIAHGNNGWGIFGQQNQSQTAVFQTQAPVDAARIAFELMHGSPFGAHKIQDFALFYTQDANPTATDPSINWIALTPTAAETSLDGSFALIDGNIIRITGSNALADNYQVIVEGAFSKITGFRLDALVGANGFVGFDGSNGNIVLSEFRAFITTPIPEPASMTLLLLGAGILARRNRAARA